MFDRYESVVLLGNGIKACTKTLSQQLEKALNASSPKPLTNTEDAIINVTYPDFSFKIALITNKSAVEERRVMAQYFGTERGDIDKITQAQSYFEISSKGSDANGDYSNDYAKIIGTMEALGQTWSLNPDGFLA